MHPVENLHHFNKMQPIEGINAYFTKNLLKIQILIDASMSLLSKKIASEIQGCANNPDMFKANILKHTTIYNQCEKAILAEIFLTKTDRINEIKEILFQLRTYIDLTKTETHYTSKSQSLHLFQQEAWHLFNDLKQCLKLITDDDT